ncbi:pyroglutamyl-peptidase I [Alkaliphilus peptidifermentans]|uniref:Pyrrolidone-carboxylate peptidase n=1 Tax=Alkaliphilus peptidifermentans DSM 18978 TaxID=1120976 RepID=A0A1G5IL58_9FIRM|nr:pyroglutamyl-peptidase I [Alkaliphilus peptidifermentans]SCY76460.1 pyroglutamyl-peptidase [Alkaliphilus peptidifermentans DSM 18978]
MKILVTGFDPFGGEKVNPAYEAVKLLPNKIAGGDIIKIEIPTVFSKSTIAVEEAINKYEPDVVLSVGQAGGRSNITVEKVAINLAEARIPDNDGEQPMDEKLQQDGETAYFATIPVKAMVKNIRKHGIPANISYTAGTYVCNSIMYNTLYMTHKKYPNIRVGFIHVPFSIEQAVGKPDGTACMSVETIAKALEFAVEAIIVNKEEAKEVMGTIM